MTAHLPDFSPASSAPPVKIATCEQHTKHCQRSYVEIARIYFYATRAHRDRRGTPTLLCRGTYSYANLPHRHETYSHRSSTAPLPLPPLCHTSATLNTYCLEAIAWPLSAPASEETRRAIRGRAVEEKW